ncbi:MAG: SIS domain-containing protein [Erysipelothrix sp.]
MRDSKQALLSYINCSFRDDLYYVLALNLLKIGEEIKNLTIDKAAQTCFVSPSTVSRFCRNLGFNNFIEFKEGFDQHNLITNYSKSFLNDIRENPREAALVHWNDINFLTENQIKSLDLVKIDRILSKIYDKKNVVFLGHQFLHFYGSYFQQNLQYFNKTTYSFFQDVDQVSFLTNTEDPTYVIIFSLGGTYLNNNPQMIDVLRKENIETVVFTQNEHSSLINFCDDTFFLEGNNTNDIGKYSLLFLIDMMVMRYGLLYSDLTLG